jgi:lipase
MTATNAHRLEVPVKGGTLRAYRWGSSGPLILGAHGITASALSLALLGERLGDAARFVAVDLRGRGDSSRLPGPYGMAAHANDLAAVLAHLGERRTVAVGHSMGAYVVAHLAIGHPQRVERAVFIEGGLPLPRPARVDNETLLAATLGPALKRLSMTFQSRGAHLDFWRRHPAFAGEGNWNHYVEAYLDYDLEGEPPRLRSRVKEQAVRADAEDMLSNEKLLDGLKAIHRPVSLIRAPRDLLDRPHPLLPARIVEQVKHEALPQLHDELVDQVNHYSIVLSSKGADAVASSIRELLSANECLNDGRAPVSKTGPETVEGARTGRTFRRFR